MNNYWNMMMGAQKGITPRKVGLLILGGVLLILMVYALWQGPLNEASSPSSSFEHPPEVAIYGAQAGDKIKAVAAGDLNGDGVLDVVVAADDASPAGRDRAGEVYLLFGPLTNRVIDLKQRAPDVALQGARLQGGLGYAIAAGDLNGDGRDDVVLGSFGAGEVYVILGSERFPKQWDLAEAPPDVGIHGGDPGDFFGLEVAVADLNGDTLDDILVGAVRDDGPDNARRDAGAVYVIWGRERFRSDYDIADGEQDLVVWGAQADDNLGFSLAAGDLSGDGWTDLAVGSLGATPIDGKRGAGVAYVLFGSRDFPSEIDLAREQTGLFRVAGAEVGDSLGVAVAVGDFNGDGQDDLVVGANRARSREGRQAAGRAYAFWGPLSEGEWRLTGRSAPLEVVRQEAQGLLGYPLVSGDLDGDGIDDMILGSLTAQDVDGTARAGQVYLVAGRTDWPATLTPADDPNSRVLKGRDADDYFGGMLASADLNEDGFAELFVGALGGDGPRNDRKEAGEILLLYGSKDGIKER